MSFRLLIYEDNENLRQSMNALFSLNPSYQLVECKSNPVDVLTDISQFQPEVILMDIDMPYMDGITALSTIRKAGIEIPVIMLTIFDDQDNIYKAICAGASGYILKHDLENIGPAIQDVLGGGAPMSGPIAKKVLSYFSGMPVEKKSLPENLTEREIEILNFLKKGLSYKMIAEECNLSIDTIRTHIKKIYKKLQVNSATEAIYKLR
ncbi:MAG: response regulator transcription factor [Saprospiraceae bacterium]